MHEEVQEEEQEEVHPKLNTQKERRARESGVCFHLNMSSEDPGGHCVKRSLH